MKDKILKILYVFMAFVITGVVLFNSLSVNVMASSNVESLPATDIDLEVTYDSDSVILEFDDEKYDIPFSYDIRLRDSDGRAYDRWVAAYMSNAGHYYYYTNAYAYHAKYTDSDAYGNSCPFSFWFSPSENRIYTITGFKDSGQVVSYTNGIFQFAKSDLYRYIAFNYWDLNDNSFNRIGLVSHHRSESTVGGVYPQMRLNSSFNFSSFYDVDGNYRSFPSDLICIYSNYEISGFYEFDNSSVFTPDYYFQYQYLFYVEGVGYTFIDSALPIREIVEYSSSDAFVYFEDYCNSHVYTSPDGVQWSEITIASTMYNIYRQMNYKWFFDNVGGRFIAQLVYSNDTGYGEEPLVKPEFNELGDVLADLNNIVSNGKPLPSGRGEGYSFEELQNMRPVEYYEFIAYGFTHSYYTRITIHYDDDSIDYIYDINSGRWGSTSTGDRGFSYCEVEYVPTISMYLYDLNKTLDDTNSLLESLGLIVHNDLKSVFDNITVSNYYLESIDSILGDMPNYTKKLDQILLSLENLEVSAPAGSGGVVDLSVIEEYLLMIDDTSELQELLQELDSSIDNVANISAFDEITDMFDTVVDGAGDTTTTLSNVFSDLVKDEDTLMKLDGVGSFIGDSISMITKAKVLDSAFQYASGLSNGITFVSAYADSFYNASGDYKPVFITGAALVCINMFIRRRE